MKKRNSLFDFNVIRSDPPIEVERLTGKRETFKKYSDGSTAKIVDEDFCPQGVAWMQKIGQARQHSTSILPALRTPGDSKKKDHCSPRRMMYCLNSPLLSLVQTVRIAQSRGTEESESQILSRLRSSRSFDHSMRDDLVRLFHTPDTLTGQEPQIIGFNCLAIGLGWFIERELIQFIRTLNRRPFKAH